MRKSKPSKIKRASLDVKKLQFLTDNKLKKVTGGYTSGDTTYVPPGRRLGGNSYWN